MNKFVLHSPYKPAGDQEDAINTIVESFNKGNKYQTLLGITGSGKTFTMASVIEKLQRPTLIISHNKVLAAQLYAEFKEFFPENAVEYFISYYDYYQPEAYIPESDLYIGKETSINKTIEKYRLSTTTSLISRRDVIVVASVSCIYGLGNPDDFKKKKIVLKRNDNMDRDIFLEKLVSLQYSRNDHSPAEGQFRVRGDIVDVYLPYRDIVVRVEFFDDEIDKLSLLDKVSLGKIEDIEIITFYPAKIFMPDEDILNNAIESIEEELEERVKELEKEGKTVEAKRLKMRTKQDIAYLREYGYCPGIENYARHLTGRKPGERPACLLDFFPDDYIVFVDESHQTIPQIRAMYNGDRRRKETLVEYGFRLPSALDNRPLTFEEWNKVVNQVLFVSATPGDFEYEVSSVIAEQIIRPTGLVDPPIIVKPAVNQVEDMIKETENTIKKGYRVLVTTLTIKMAEELADYLLSKGFRVLYLHSKVDTLDRVDILNKLRTGEIEIIVGINLLREGLDLPEVALVCILDADKEGFLRSYRSLIQIAGRTARNVEGRVIIYADRITDSIKKAVEETERRRKKQLEYNKKYGIIPKTIIKPIRGGLSIEGKEIIEDRTMENKSSVEIIEKIMELTREMKRLADRWEFEEAAKIRDRIRYLRRLIDEKQRD